LDQELTFKRNINLLCRSCYYQLRQLRVVFCSLTSDAALTLINSFVVSRLDYCSALYVGLPAARVVCLDRVLRTAACLIGRIPRYGHVAEYMRDVLHWLPFPQRIIYRPYLRLGLVLPRWCGPCLLTGALMLHPKRPAPWFSALL
jgi:hypothetical protein